MVSADTTQQSSRLPQPNGRPRSKGYSTHRQAFRPQRRDRYDPLVPWFCIACRHALILTHLASTPPACPSCGADHSLRREPVTTTSTS